MRYLIDGHNLIGQMEDLSLADPDDEAKLVLRLVQYAAGRKAKIVVVFDHGLPAGRSPLSQGPVEAVFASSRSTADRVIRERVLREKQPDALIVVSNDHEVIASARSRKITVTRSSDFARQLNMLAAPHSPRRDDGPTLSAGEVDFWLKEFGGEEAEKANTKTQRHKGTKK